MSEALGDGAFRTTPWIDWLATLVERHPKLVGRLADIETESVEAELAARPIDRPIFISGLARAGTTILLEILSQHPDTGSHQYRDFPFVQFPYWWNKLLNIIENKNISAKERAHGDGILVTPSSPEAMEEVIWMHFFPSAHDPHVSAVLDGAVEAPAFERFYRAHLGKLLLARGAKRYLSKGNYNLTRLGYIRRVFPDARMIVPVRSPFTHVPSMLRQHLRFGEGLASNPKGLAHLRRVGHYEFGPDRRPINTGDCELVASIESLWANGEELRGWARYWASIHGFLADWIEEGGAFGEACHVLRYEDLCESPAACLSALLSHAGLEPPGGFVETHAARLAKPRYYDPRLSAAEMTVIREETASVASRFGYDLV